MTIKSGAAGLLLLVILAVLVSLIIRQRQKRHNMRLLNMVLGDSTQTSELKMALGADGIKELLPYFFRQMGSGDSVAKLLILELIRGIEFPEKASLVQSAFAHGSLEVKLSIIDQIFSWNLPYDLLPDILKHCDESFAEYLLRKIFLNYRDIEENRLLSPLKEQAANLSQAGLSAEGRRMFAYVFENAGNAYGELLGSLLTSDKKEDRLLASEIMVAFLGIEDEVNRRHLSEVIAAASLNPDELEEMIEMCSEYDEHLLYLKQDLGNYYNYSFIKKICTYYEPTWIIRSFNNSLAPIPMALVLVAAGRLDKISLSLYEKNARLLLIYLRALNQEAVKIKRSGHLAGPLILDEIQTLKLTLASLLLEYFCLQAGQSRTGGSLEALKQGLAEGSLDQWLKYVPEQTAAALKEILTVDLPPDSEDYDPSLLRVSEQNPLLEHIYQYLGGVPMDIQLTENIEKLIVLKSIPMFRELDVFTLQQIQKISAYKKILAGEMLMREGEEGDSLYIVISGKVGVYKNEKQISEVSKGDLVGEMAIIDKQKRSATIKTLEESTFLVIQGDDFMKLLDRNSCIAKSVIRTLTFRLRQM